MLVWPETGLKIGCMEYGPARPAVLAVLDCQMLVRAASGWSLGVYAIIQYQLGFATQVIIPNGVI